MAATDLLVVVRIGQGNKSPSGDQAGRKLVRFRPYMGITDEV